MKTYSQWAREICPDIKTFRVTLTRADIEVIVEDIQRDSLTDTMASTTAQQEFEMTKGQCELLESAVQIWKAKAEEYKINWHQARRYLRAANKGAERNNQVMRLLAHDNKVLLERIKQLTNQ